MGNMCDKKSENYFEKILEHQRNLDEKISGIKEDVAVLHEKMTVNSQDHQDIKKEFNKQDAKITVLEGFKDNATGITKFLLFTGTLLTALLQVWK